MPTDQVCPECGGPLMAGAQAGLCARCLLRAALRHPDERDGNQLPEPGDFIGNYRIVRLLGEGGMGMVYLAEQEQPIARFVAVKVIKLGMDTRAVLARFVAEQQALALMDHPNIAHVYDAGSSESGRPYFVMEHVPGVPITTYCDQHRLRTRQRLELFLEVVGAVQHAHQKGVIHRDLKPSNILVMERDGKAVPKIIDFGLAKATAKTYSEETLFTEAGALIGTPEYLSPEQASLSGGDIDTRTDIYSLGVLLYELLVGTRPFELNYLRKQGYDEIRRVIREEDPPTPTSRFSSLGDSAAAIATQRATDANGLQKQVRGDLEWITMTALAKDRDQRYASASELAADIVRHLRDEPVMAGPPSPAYRLRKLVRKNRGAVLTLAAVFASLLLGLSTSTALYFRAEQQRVEAERLRHEAERERSAAEQGRLEAHRQSDRAESERLVAEQASAVADRQRKEAETQHAEAERQRTVAEVQSDEARKQGQEAETQRLSAEKQRAVAERESRVAVEQSQAAEEQRAAAEHQRLTALRQSYVANLIAADLHIRSNEIGEARRRLALSPVGLRGWEWRYLMWKSDTSMSTLAGQGANGGEASLAGFSEDGARLFRAWADGFEWWPITGGRTAPSRHNFGVLIGADTYGTRLLSATGRVLDAATGNTISTLAGAHFEAICAAFDGGGHLVTGGKDGLIEIWDAASGQSRGKLEAHKGGVRTVAFSSDGQRIVSGGEDHMLRVWDAAAAHPMYAIAGHGSAVLAAAWSADRRSIVSGSGDKTARLWDAATGKPLHTLSGHECGVQAVAMSPDGATIATGACQTVRLWEARSGRLLATLAAPWQVPIRSVTFNGNGGALAAASGAGEIKVWDARTYGGGILKRGDTDVDRVAVSPSGRRIARHNARTQTLDVWDVHEQKTAWSIPESGHFSAMAFSTDSKRLAAGMSDGTVRIWNAVNGHQSEGPSKLAAAVPWLAFGPDGTRLLLGSAEHLAVWDNSPQNAPQGLSLPAGPAAFSPDGKRIAVGQASGDTGLWEAGSNKLLGVLKGHSGAVEAVAFSADGSRIVTGSRDQTIRVWDAAAFDELLVLGDRNETATSLVFSPDGMRLYSVSAEGTVRVWDTRTNAALD